ncbi:hypothetical protein J3458_002760 [Metarhizium acridum]|uniref:uncharacterized protein n=1 Tax=Metarhizium acridum TaxID=92637 RepID=UPI001C6CC33C|nr:hypothetical protein J3458_002760 [Metarhizium acridum]
MALDENPLTIKHFDNDHYMVVSLGYYPTMEHEVTDSGEASNFLRRMGASPERDIVMRANFSFSSPRHCSTLRLISRDMSIHTTPVCVKHYAPPTMRRQSSGVFYPDPTEYRHQD